MGRAEGVGMEIIVLVLVQLITGGAGGNVIGQIASALNLGVVGNTIVGAIGGICGTWLASMIPGLDTLVGSSANSPGMVGGLDLGALAGQGAVGLVSGAVLTAIVGLVKSTLAKG